MILKKARKYTNKRHVSRHQCEIWPPVCFGSGPKPRAGVSAEVEEVCKAFVSPVLPLITAVLRIALLKLWGVSYIPA